MQLDGWKTHIVAYAGILAAWATYFAKASDLQTAIEATFAGLGLSALRSGVTTENAKPATPDVTPPVPLTDAEAAAAWRAQNPGK